MKVLVCAPCSCSLCVCVYVLDWRWAQAGELRTLAELERSAIHGESERSSVSVESTEQAASPPLTHTQTNKQHRETGHECSLKAAAAAAAAAQQTQPWPTLRSKGSNGSSKKFSKAKRCGNATGLFSLLLSSFFKIVSALLKYTLPAAVIVTK